MRIAPQILLSDHERADLQAAAAAGATHPRLALRARIILLAAEGIQNKAIAAHLGVGRVQVARWRDRYAQARLAGIEHDLPRGAPPVRMDVGRLVELASEPATAQLSTRSLAVELGVSASSVSRHWRSTGLPARQENQALPGLDLDGRAVDVVGLYVAPREHALVVACGMGGREAQPGAQPARPGTAMQRHLATSFMTALQLVDADASDLPAAMPAPDAARPADWLDFLRELETGTPDGITLHLIADNHVTQQHPDVREWLARHPRLVVHPVAGAAAWRRAVQQLLRDAPWGFAAGIPQVLAFLSEPVRWPLRWLRQGDAGQPGTFLSPVTPRQAAPWARDPAPDEHNERTGSVSAFLPRSAAIPSAGVMAGLECVREAAQPVDSAKLLPPRQGGQAIVREALMARLQEARRRRCVVVQGQAGSGKTSTLAAWRKSLISLGFDVCWLALGAEDNAPDRFFDCLSASLDAVDPSLTRDATAPGGECDAPAIEHWVIQLVQALGQRQRDLVLILDDLHHVTSPHIVQALQRLIDYAPAQLHLAFASRSALPLALECLRAQGLVAEFDMRDLCFTAEESERFLRQQLGAIDPRDAAAIHDLTDGWVAGLQLFAVDLRARRGAGYPVVPVRDARSFVAYFEREVVVRLAPDDLDMLVRMATCQSFCVALCASMLGKHEADIGARLARLEADNLFLAQVGSPNHSSNREPWYRIHPLLRETLLERHGRLPEPDRQAMHAAAWRWFDARGRLDDAVFHAVRAGDEAAAAAMVEACGQALLARGELSQLAALLRLLPSAQVRQRHGLLVVNGYLQLYARNVDGLRHTLDELAAHDAADPLRTYTLGLLRAGLALQLDDPDTVLGMLPQLWDIPPGADDLAWSSRGNVLSWLFLQRGEYDEVRRLQDDITLRTGAPRSSLFGRYIRATSLALEGQVERAGQHVRDVLREAERQGPAFVGLACLAAGLLADILYEANDPEAACRLLEPRIAGLERVSLPDVVLRVLMVLSNAHWLAGRRVQANACLDRLEAYAVRFGLDRVLAEALVLRLRRHLQEGETERANTVLQCLAALAEKHPGGTRGDRIRQAAALGRIEMAMSTQDFAGAAAMIDALLASAAAGGSGAASLTLQRAMAQQALHNEGAARDAFGRAIRMGHGASLLRSLLDATASAPEAFAALARTPQHEPVLAFYVKRLLAAAGTRASGVSADGAGGPSSMSVLSEREGEILGLLAQAMSNKKIASVLNLSPETVKWHLKNIYAKLGVNGRGKAAARLRDLAAGELVARAA
ncbi:HTH-type transcriptional regulator MalT [Cupriavidus yeoncheonensis]|uniref:HTH-type transcriptional regulator MalT n=1 Tax=Cupriavidus yeoncheonensis TaxID=1462994 RepID=A0A916N008_9BURK|nr:LuxR C-terminal-related transcriptional regulator [Cupriavidus yeoncheonensis]CAG2154899.1 HTH-type transcriptional regulator MalT [Cupriavidus yeoncheonensis]